MAENSPKQEKKNAGFFPVLPSDSDLPHTRDNSPRVGTSPRQPHGGKKGAEKGSAISITSNELGTQYPSAQNGMHPMILDQYARYLRRRHRSKGVLPQKGKKKDQDICEDGDEFSGTRTVSPDGEGGEGGKARERIPSMRDWNPKIPNPPPDLHDSFGNLAYHRLFQTDPFAAANQAVDHPKAKNACYPSYSNSVSDIRSPKMVPDPNDRENSTAVELESIDDLRAGSVDEPPRPMARPPGAHSKAAFATFLAFTEKREFWLLLQYAFRIALIGILLPALLVYFFFPSQHFFTLTYVLSGALISASMSVGQMVTFIAQYLRAALMWLPLSLACVAAGLNRSPPAWFVVYFVLISLLAFVNANTTRRMSLLLINIALVTLLSGDENFYRPFIILASWSVGVGFAMLAILLPYPILAARDAVRVMEGIFENTATCFAGMLSCFWAENNTERSMFMVRIRHLVRSIDFLIEELEVHNAHSFYEILIFDTYERYEVREEKVKLLWKLKMNLRTMERVINALQERPKILTDCARSRMFKRQLAKPIQRVSKAMGELLLNISHTKTYAELRQAHLFFESTGRAIKQLQEEFESAHKTGLYENEEEIFSDTHHMEEFFPLFSFFIFSIVNFWTVLNHFKEIVDRHEGKLDSRGTLRFVFRSVVDTLWGNVTLVQNLIRGSEEECRIFIEAGKVSLAMLLSILFFYNVNARMLLLTGPTIIAFVSGMNPVETVHASGMRLTGTLIGSVIGFFGVTLIKKLIFRIISICVIVFVMSFSRLNMEFAPICGTCTFVSMTLLSSQHQGADYTISRIQQNAFSIFVYCFISVTIFPLSPSEVLYEKRMQALKLSSQSFKKIMGLLYEASSYYECISKKRLNMHEQHPMIGETCSHSNTTFKSTSHEPFNFALPHNPPEGARGIDSLASLAHPPPKLETISKFRGAYNDEKKNMFIVPVDFSKANPRGADKGSDLHHSLMPRAFFSDQEDAKIVDIFDTIFEMLHLVLSTKSIMNFAANEFSIFPSVYPTRATGDVHIALYRLCVLLYTMACSWERMRAKGYFTEDMIHVFHNLMPLGTDLTECFERFVFVCDLYVRSPSPELCSDLMTGLSQFRTICVEMSDRTEYDLLEVIRKVISEVILAKYVVGGGENDTCDNFNYKKDGKAGDTLAYPAEVVNESYLGAPEIGYPFDPMGRKGVQNATMIFQSPHVDKKDEKESEMHPPYGKGPLDDGAGKEHTNPPRGKSDSTGTNSFSTYFTTHSTCGSSGSNFIHLNNSFVMPTTALDLEGLHTFTLTLVMFGREMRRFLFGLEQMLQSL